MSKLSLSILKEYHSNLEYFNKIRPILTKEVLENQSESKILEIINNHFDTYKTLPTLREIALNIPNIPSEQLRQQLVETIKEINASEPINKDFLLDKSVEYIRDRIFTEGLIIGSEFIDSKNENKKLKAKELIEKSMEISIDQDVGLDFNDLQKRIDYYTTKRVGLKYKDFKGLNEKIGDGFLPGSLNVVLAPPGLGKSLFLTATISDFVKQGKNVLLISMEMSDFEIVKRVDANILDLPINDLKNIPKEVVWDRFNKIKDTLGKFYTKSYAPGVFSSYSLKHLIEMYKSQENITFDAIFLDYLGIMKSDRVSFNAGMYNYIKSIGEEVRAIAVDYQIPIFTCSQLNRSAVGNLDADNSTISDSMGTAMTADFMVFMIQNETMKEKNEITFKITKNRYTGNTSSFTMKVDYEKMKYIDINEQDFPIELVSEITEISKIENQINNLDWN